MTEQPKGPAPGGREWLGEFTAGQLSNEAYHAAPGISKSHLDTIANGSPRHYWQEYINPDRPARHETEALMLGNAIHAAVLQPSLFEFHYAAEPEGPDGKKLDKRKKIDKEIYDQFMRESRGKTPITRFQYNICLGIRDAIQKHPIARGLLQGGVAEQSFFCIDPETRALRKCRADYLTEDYVIDIKSTLDAGPDSFERDATNLRYDVAVPWYLDTIDLTRGLARPRKWIWLAIEKAEPFAIGIYYAQQHDIIAARDCARKNFHTILRHRELNAWPDYGEVMRPLNLKPWKKR